MKRGGSEVDAQLPVSGDLEIVMAKELKRQYAKRERADAVILFLESCGVDQRLNFVAQSRSRGFGSGGGSRVLSPPEGIDDVPPEQDAEEPRRKGSRYSDFKSQF